MGLTTRVDTTYNSTTGRPAEHFASTGYLEPKGPGKEKEQWGNLLHVLCPQERLFRQYWRRA